jgi:hypothetical protein
VQRTGRSAKRPRRLSSGRSSAGLNWTELQRGHLRLIHSTRGTQSGQLQFVLPIPLVPFKTIVQGKESKEKHDSGSSAIRTASMEDLRSMFCQMRRTKSLTGRFRTIESEVSQVSKAKPFDIAQGRLWGTRYPHPYFANKFLVFISLQVCLRCKILRTKKFPTKSSKERSYTTFQPLLAEKRREEHVPGR